MQGARMTTAPECLGNIDAPSMLFADWARGCVHEGGGAGETDGAPDHRHLELDAVSARQGFGLSSR